METGPHDELRFCEAEGLELTHAGTDALEQGGHRKRVRTIGLNLQGLCKRSLGP